MKRIIFLLNFALVVTTAQGQTAVQAWVQRYDGPGKGADVARAIAVDTNGNVFVTGSSYNGSNADYATLAYSNNGAPLWTNRYHGPVTNDYTAVAMSMDTAGRVFVTGHNGYEYATVAYSNGGEPLWTNRYSGAAQPSHATALAVDSNGNVFVTGEAGASASRADYATVAYSSAGAKLWTNRYNGSGGPLLVSEASAIGVDSSGQVFVTGRGATSAFSYEFATIAYSNTGTPLWTNHFLPGPLAYGQANAIAVDTNGHVFVTGSSIAGYSTVTYTGAGVPLWTNRFSSGQSISQATAIGVGNSGNVFVTGYMPFSGAGNDCATVAYSNTGLPLWTNHYNGPANGDDQATALAVDRMGNVFVTGFSTNSGGYAYATVSYSDAGTPLWTNRYSGVGNGTNYANALAVDRGGNVFVTGQSWNGSNFDYVTIKYALSVPLKFQAMDNQLVLSWTNAAFGWTNLTFALQSAPALTGTFTNLPGATSPYTNSITGARQFFRLISN